MQQQRSMMFSRREMLQISAAGVAATAMPGMCGWAKDASDAMPGISLQLYSVRKDCSADFDKALAEVAGMGFEAVEFAGYHKYGGDAKGLKKALDGLGLKVAGTHIGTGTLIGDELKKTIAFHETIGCKYLVVPGDKRFSDPDGSKELAEIFNEAARQLKPVGMQCGYHNHTHEFKKDGDKTFWELFAERTSEDVVLQQDVGWSVAAGQDAAALIRKYPGRSQIIHCKPTLLSGNPGRPIVGEDSVPWAEILVACQEAGGTEWLTIEQERYLPDTSPMDCVRMSLKGLKRVIADL